MKIICICNNYKNPGTEKSKPFFFLKPETCIITKNRPFFIPEHSKHILGGVEIVVKIDKLGKFIQEKFAHKYYNEIAIGIDFTAKDVLDKCVNDNLPWDMSKSFDGSSPLSDFINKNDLDVQNINFSLHIDGKKVQEGNTNQMLLSIAQIISYVSQYTTLKIGDIIYTGTPMPLQKVSINNKLAAFIGDKEYLGFYIK